MPRQMWHAGSRITSTQTVSRNSVGQIVRVLEIIIIIDRFYIALFFALEQTHCARM